MNRPLYFIGLGQQARAWAMNFHDSKLDFKILLRPGSLNISWAQEKDYEICDLDDFQNSQIATYIFLTSDHSQEQIFHHLKNKVAHGSHFIFIHGFTPLKAQLKTNYPQFDFSLLAPKAIASELRFRYETKQPLAAFYQCPEHRDLEIKHLANALGITALYKGTFEEETYADLFSEQSLLCSLIPYGILASYNILRERGISRELAFIECFMESKLIIDALMNHGPHDLFNLISPNALVGGEWANQVLFDKNGPISKIFEQLADDVFNGDFIKKLKTTDFEQIKKNVNERWNQEELQKTYDELKEILITKSKG